MEVLFWFSLGVVFYAYLGYPIALFFLSLAVRQHKRGHREEGVGALPRVSLLISAYNEERVMEKKLHNALAADYPQESLEIIVVSDGSNDKTIEIASRFAGRGVSLLHYEGRIGKTACLNRAVPAASGEIVVFSDANSLYDQRAVAEMVKHFSNSAIGFVTGHTRYQGSRKEGVGESIGLYARVERMMKKLESVVGSVVGADGAIFAIRKHLYEPLRDVDINDFVIPLNVVRKGYRGILEEKAFCTEEAGKTAGQEFSRQARITNRTIRAIVHNRDMLNFSKHGIFAFELLSHKVVRFLVPFFLLSLLVSNALLVGKGLGYAAFFACQIAGYGLPLFVHSRFTLVAKTFIVANAAVAWGWIKFLAGDTYTSWTTTRS